MSDRLPVVLYGASGFTGRLVAKALQQRGETFAISGRDRAKLDALAVTLSPRPEVIVAALDDAPALEKMAARARVVLDCAGPFARMGKPVVDAALAAGSHFLDITGEAAFLLPCLARNEEAKKRGVAIINAVGFDVVPTDCAAALAAEAAGSPVESVRIAFAAMGASATQGTSRSAIESAHLGGAAWVDGALKKERTGAHVWRVPFVDPIGPRDAISAPWGDIATAPRSTGSRNVRVFISLPPRLARILKWSAPFGSVMRLPGVAALADRYVRSLPEGPTEAERARSKFAVHAEAIGKNGAKTAWVTGGDGYDFTASSAALCASLAAKPDFKARGTRTPSQAFGAGPLLDALVALGAARYGT